MTFSRLVEGLSERAAPMGLKTIWPIPPYKHFTPPGFEVTPAREHLSAPEGHHVYSRPEKQFFPELCLVNSPVQGEGRLF